jgi:glycosyltransferase involved in cell wall biosynthesis
MNTNAQSFDPQIGRGSKARIRVLEIVGNAIVGGMESHVGNLVANLPADTFEIICLCPYESHFTASLRRLGHKVFIAPVDDDPLWRSIEMAAEIVRQNEVHLIHAHLPNAHTLAGLVGRLTDTPAVATLHARGMLVQELSVTRLTGTHLIVVCQETYAQALATGVPPRNVTLIPNGIDTRRFTPERNGADFRAAIGVPSNAPLVGFVGRLSPEKGPDRFLLAAERIRQSRPDAHFVMIGDGPLREELEIEIERGGFAGCLHMVEVRHDMEAAYPAFDLLLQTSRSEGMPLVVLEAMACGVPVVAVGIGGVAEVVEHGSTGWLVSPVQWDDISRDALRLLADPQRLKRMGLLGRERVETRFDLRECVSETSSLFRRLAASGIAEQSIAPATALRGRRRSNGANGPALKLTGGTSA